MNAQQKDKLIREQVALQYEKYYRLAFSYMKNEQDALDVVQEAAYKAIFHSAKLKDPAMADSWICRVVINQAFDHFRKQRDYVHLDQALEIAIEGDQVDVDLDRAFRRLSGEERQIIRMKYYEGFKINEIAGKLGCNENTVKSKLYRGLKKMKNLYKDAGRE